MREVCTQTSGEHTCSDGKEDKEPRSCLFTTRLGKFQRVSEVREMASSKGKKQARLQENLWLISASWHTGSVSTYSVPSQVKVRGGLK
jgi:hypothetical protein